jgi:hypothetical protein
MTAPDRLAPGGLESQHLRDHIDRHGGFTLGLSDGCPVVSGYSVAVSPALSLCFDETEWDDEHVDAWLTRAVTAADAVTVGGWLDAITGLVHLDVVEVVADAMTAVRLGRSTRQRGVFDLDLRRLVRL